MAGAFGWNTASMTPKRDNVRAIREPALDYLLRTYADNPAFPAAAAKLKDMTEAGVTLTTELVDYAIKASYQEGLGRLQRQVDRHKQRAKLANSTSLIYFIRNGSRVKIGTSINPEQRVRSISLSVDHIQATMPGGRDTEADLHQRFAEWRITGTEWFHDSPELQAFITMHAHVY